MNSRREFAEKMRQSMTTPTTPAGEAAQQERERIAGPVLSRLVGLDELEAVTANRIGAAILAAPDAPAGVSEPTDE